MPALADDVLPLIRTRADLHRWSTANAHGAQMHAGIDILEEAAGTDDPAEVYAVTHKALASAITVIARADDSSGIIGDACRRLLKLHPQAARAAHVPTGTLINWMMKFQFDGEVDFFELDPVAYAPALGEIGLRAYRKRLAEVEAGLGARPSDEERWSSPHSHAWFTLDWNAQRLAVLDRDVDAIIRTHARNRKVAAWLEDTAEALEEIGEYDLAIDWAKQATDFGPGHQSLKAADRWCRLLEEHRPAEAVGARLSVFRRWPSSTTAAGLFRAAGSEWASYADEVAATLSSRPRDAVMFTLLTLRDVRAAWDLAMSLDLSDDDVWSELMEAYERIDPVATLPVHRRLVEHELVDAGAQHYRRAARRLVRMRKLAAGTESESEVDDFIADLRELHRRRPRLRQEFDKARLP